MRSKIYRFNVWEAVNRKRISIKTLITDEMMITVMKRAHFHPFSFCSVDVTILVLDFVIFK